MTRPPCSLLVTFWLLVLSVSFATESNGQHLDRGMELLRARKFVDAIQEFEISIQEGEKNVQAHYALAKAHRELASGDPSHYYEVYLAYQRLKPAIARNEEEAARLDESFNEFRIDIEHEIADSERSLTIAGDG